MGPAVAGSGAWSPWTWAALGVAKSGLHTLMHSDIPKGYPWPSETCLVVFLFSLLSLQHGEGGHRDKRVLCGWGQTLVDISLEGCASSPAFSHQQDSSVKLANAGQKKKKKNCGALILQRSKPSLKRQISCYASFLIYFYFRESGSKSA